LEGLTSAQGVELVDKMVTADDIAITATNQVHIADLLLIIASRL
jgi:hypothetical protein